ncbi:amidohydrolase family protein [Eubacteriales bacterium OttesenSCG-928-M02]|nr:amidohydrolase family protein [Eubacteriales bacterium OttesenSCG-928-M02]
MNIIDVHMHFFNHPQSQERAKEAGHENSFPHLEEVFRRLGIVFGIAMGTGQMPEEETPKVIIPQIPYMGKDLSLEEGFSYPPFAAFCAGVNPTKITKKNLAPTLDAYAKTLAHPRCVGLKLYAGYQYYYVADPVYDPFYDLARQFHVPVVIHTGDTANPMGMLKYSHPLTVDEAAVLNPDVQFVMAHFGNPFFPEAAEVAKKNPNVAIDLSGMAVGTITKKDFLENYGGYVQHLKTWMGYLDQYEKLMWGTDWPLVNIDNYLDLFLDIVPPRHHGLVFYENAVNTFGKIAPLLKNNCAEDRAALS